MKTDKHAYLIMAHHRPDLLDALIEELDYPGNDIYVHIDKKNSDMKSELRAKTNYSELVFVDSTEVNWGGYSQIECALRLLEAASDKKEYRYYHLMTGSTFPIKSQKYIHDFFESNYGAEFIDIDEGPMDSERADLVFLFNEMGRELGLRKWWRQGRSFHEAGRLVRTCIRYAFYKLQKLAGRSRFSKYDMEFKKGLAYWSITDDFARYLLGQEPHIKEMFKYSAGCDEVFAQVMVWNSDFRGRLFNAKAPSCSSMRLSTWNLEKGGKDRPQHNFAAEDLEFISNSEALFAFKFEGDDGPELIRVIAELNSGRDK